MTQPHIGIIGLGRMGGGMSRHLLDEGFPVTGFDVSEDALASFVDEGGNRGDSPAAVASRSDVVLTSLPNSAAVEAVFSGDDGILAATSETIAIETSTIDPDTTLRVVEKAADTRINVIDAPVSGGPENARNGSLTVIAGGPGDVLEDEAVVTVLDVIGTKRYHVGDVGAGHTTKLLNNVMSMGNLALAMEAVALGTARGIDGEILLEVLGNAGGASNQFLKRMPRVLNRNFDPGFTVDFARKDLGLALETAQATGYPMFVTSTIHQLYTEASADDLGTSDASAIVKLFERTTDAPVEADRDVDEHFEGY